MNAAWDETQSSPLFKTHELPPMARVEVQNWKRDITYDANSVEVAGSVDDIVRIVKDTDRYPSPVRAKGSHHSTTQCVVAEGGTVIDMTRMNKILDIDKENKTVRMEAGVLHIDAARELEKHGLQFYVNVEIGNLTVGSGACCGTKDASYHSSEEGWEFGQVSSYVIEMKVVTADGRLITVSDDDRELMEAMRSSYGMLGIVYEVTYRVKAIRPMVVNHERFHVDEFAHRLDELIAQNKSMMLYLFPFLDTVVAEYRYDGEGPVRSNSWQWRLRNWVWKTVSPALGKTISTFVPSRFVRSCLLNLLNRGVAFLSVLILRDCNSSPADQIIRYPETSGYSAYTFSIWAFPKETYPQTIRAYFQFCKDYYRENGFRCDLGNVGYHIAQDRQALFSYTRDGFALTLDPVSTGSEGWEDFLDSYNQFCMEHNAKPLFNQSGNLTGQQAKAAFGPEIEQFSRIRSQHDPTDRFYTRFFRQLLE